MKKQLIKTHCRICSCVLSRKNGTYGQATPSGRSHGTKHHLVAKRFFTKTKNDSISKMNPIFKDGDYPQYKGQMETLCYECHEELLHNPIFLPNDIDKFAKLVEKRFCDERGKKKTTKRKKIGQRIKLLNEVISVGLDELLK